MPEEKDYSNLERAFSRIRDKYLCPKKPCTLEQAIKGFIVELVDIGDMGPDALFKHLGVNPKHFTYDDLKTEVLALTNLMRQYIQYLDPHDTDSKCVDEAFFHFHGIKEELDEMLQEQFPEIPFRIGFRVKNFFSYWDKIWRNNSAPSKTVYTIRDLLAFRIILKNTDPKEYVIDCYHVHEAVISFLTMKFNAKQRDASSEVKDTDGFDITSFVDDDIYVPTKSEIPKLMFLKNAKNYIFTPKKNGYQAVQSTLYFADLDIFIEIQVLTLIMQNNNDHHKAAHDINYEGKTQLKKRKASQDFRRYNNIRGFYSKDGVSYTDTIGLWDPRFY